MKKITMSFLIILLTTTIFAVTTSFFSDDSIKDFERGKLKGISINEKGELYLAPSSKTILENDDIFVWDIVKDKKGNIFASTGVKGKIYQIDKNGKSKLYKNLDSVSVKTLAISKNQILYAATSPKGRIISFNKTGKTIGLAKFDETYIWDMKFAPTGELYVTTGNPARLYSVSTKTGKKTLLFESKTESHFLCLAINKAGYTFFGSEGKGLLYKMDLNKKVKVVYDTYEDEISCLHIDNNNKVYFGTASQVRKRIGNNFDYTDSFNFTEKGTKNYTSKIKKKKRIPLKNSIYSLDLEGHVKKIFTMSKISFFSLVTDKKNNLYAGTGDFGVIYKITPTLEFSRIIRIRENQILKLLINNNSLYAATGNDGKVIQLDFNKSNIGTFTSLVYDTYATSQWGTISVEGDFPTGTSIKIMTRSGNSDTPDKSWNKWSKTHNNSNGHLITSPKARFIQYKIILKSKNLGVTPLIHSVKIPYLRENRAPRIIKILVKTSMRKRILKKSKFKPGYCNISWLAKDADRDQLKYSLYFRFSNDLHWRLLRNNIYKNIISFKTELLPDGYYYFRIIASDINSNTEKTYKTAIKDSKKYLLDSKAPLIKNLQANVLNDKIIIRGNIVDKFSNILKINYSINARKWYNSNPSDGIFDSKNEKIKIVINRRTNPHLFTGKNIIIIRTSDTQNNWTTSKIFFDINLNKNDASINNNRKYFIKHDKLNY